MSSDLIPDLAALHAGQTASAEAEAYAPALSAITAALRKTAGPVLVVIDGRCASGKTTFAQRLGGLIPCSVFHMDDFFLPPEMRTPERLAEPGGNVHYERAEDQLFGPLSRGETVAYDRFNCQIGSMEAQGAVAFQRLSVVEGSYSHHPALAEYPTLRIFFTCSPEVQLARLARRAPEKLEAFQTRWIPMEEKYFTAFDIQEKADVVVDTSAIPTE